MKYRYKLQLIRIFSICLVFSFLIFIFPATTTLGDDPNNIVYINPSNKIVSADESFTININCDPDQPIKSFEFKLSFDASLLEANLVSEGNIFNGYSTFFNSGIINNSVGTIINVYGLILGSGNVTSTGSFADITFTTKNNSGISSINIYEVGVTNETAYIPITTNNGSVQIDIIAPEISDNSPAQGNTGDTYTFLAYVTDNCDTAENLSVNVDWSHGANSGNDSMSHIGSNYFEKTVNLDLNSINNLNYNFYVSDSYGNTNTTSILSASVIDNDFPQIGNVQSTPPTQEVDSYVNISAEITDNIAIDQVFLNITYPDSSYENISINSNLSVNTYFCNKTFGQYGTHDYFIFAYDQNDNKVTSSTNSFSIGDFTAPVISNIQIATSNPLDTNSTIGWINITCNAVDNVAVTQVFLNITNPDSSWNNVSMNSMGSNNYFINSSSAFSVYGNFSYFIWAIDGDSNDQNSDSTVFSMPPNYDVNMDGFQNVLDLVSVSNNYAQTGSSGWIREDVDNNGIVQVLDFVIISNHYGEGWWV